MKRKMFCEDSKIGIGFLGLKILAMLMILFFSGCNNLHETDKNNMASDVVSKQRIGRVFVISGPSGVGKTTVSNRLIEHFSGRLIKIVTVTTRSPRPGEINGVDYHFIDDATFSRYTKENKLLEWATVHKKYCYGTPADPVFSNIEKGIDSLLVIDPQGVEKIRKNFPDLAESMVTIFMKPQTLDVLRERLSMRGTERSEEIERRLSSVDSEMEASKTYRHIVISGTRDEDFAAIVKIFDDPSSTPSKNILPLQENSTVENKKPKAAKIQKTRAKSSRKMNVAKSQKIKKSPKGEGHNSPKSRSTKKTKAPKRQTQNTENPETGKKKSKKSPKPFTVDHIPVGPIPAGPVFL